MQVIGFTDKFKCEKCNSEGKNNVVVDHKYTMLCDECIKPYNITKVRVIKWDKIKIL